MAIFRAYEEKGKDDLVYFALRNVSGGSGIRLVICDASGEEQYSILGIKPEGTLMRFKKGTGDDGIQRNENGQIKLDE